ncbi:MAG TPA: DinB family protein [Terriglobales bacterium]|nr:DinB family protein [Terriglobales bacterium]
MLPLIRDLHAYQAWADSEIFRLIDATPAARTNPEVRKLLNHIYTVHRFFILLVQGEPPTREEMMKELSLDELRPELQNLHVLSEKYMPKLREAHLHDKVVVPWFKEFEPSCLEALTQAALHSVNHRGQLLTLLRTLGAPTKPLDYIVWVSYGRPAPQWETVSVTAS